MKTRDLQVFGVPFGSAADDLFMLHTFHVVGWVHLWRTF